MSGKNPALYWLIAGFILVGAIVAIGALIKNYTNGAIALVFVLGVVLLIYIARLPGMPKILIYFLIIAFLVIAALFAYPGALPDIARILGR
jgi:hypothetical protein